MSLNPCMDQPNSQQNSILQSKQKKYHEIKPKKKSGFYVSATSMLSKGLQLNLKACLTDNDRIKVHRGFNVPTGIDVILKIIRIGRSHSSSTLATYRKILDNAESYYRRTKPTSYDSIIQKPKIRACIIEKPINQTPHYDPHSTFPHHSQNYQTFLQFTRPYLSGRSMHEQVYVHSSFPYGRDELQVFMKQALSLMVTQTPEPTFVPTLDNIYFDGIQIVGNHTAVQTLLFLKHQSSHLAVENFKQLYCLLPSDPRVFCQWERMRQYLMEGVKVKAFFVMLFCFMTVRSPGEMVLQQKVNEQDLEWGRLLVGSRQQDEEFGEDYDIKMKTKKNKREINQSNKIISLIKQIPERWNKLLNKPQNKYLLQKYSTHLFSELKPSNIAQNVPNQQKNYFYNLFYKIFVREQQFGWRELFKQIPLREFMKGEGKERDGKEEEGKNRAIDEPRQSEQHRGRWRNKCESTKKSFILLHKYFLTKDITHHHLAQQSARQYAGHLHFQTYLPLKLSLPLTATLRYHQWFEIFFTESQDHRPCVLEAAQCLYQLLVKEFVQMMRAVKQFEWGHVRRLLYVVGAKLGDYNKGDNRVFKELKYQIKRFVRDNRSYEETFTSLKKQFSIIENGSLQTPSIPKIKALIESSDYKRDYPDLMPFLIAYLMVESETTKSTLETTNVNVTDFIKQKVRDMNSMDRDLIGVLEVLAQRVPVKPEFKQRVRVMIE